VVKVIWHKTPSPPQTDGSIVFARWRQSASHVGKLAPLFWRIWLNLCFLRPTRVHNPNGKSIGSAVFAGLTSVTDRPTYRPTDRPRCSVCNNRPHLRSRPT